MPLVKNVSVKLGVENYEDAKLKIERLTVASKELGDQHPEIKPQIDSAKALLEARLLRMGIQRELSGATMDGGRSGIFGRLFGLFGGGAGSAGGGTSVGGSFLSSIGGAGNGLGWAAIAGAIASLLPEIGGLVAGFAAATAGVGAFGILAIPTFDKIKNAYTAISTAQKNYQQALALEKEFPTTAHAAAAAAALQKLKAAQESVGGSTAKAVTGIQNLVKTFDQMGRAFQPTALKVFDDLLKIANTLLPQLKPFATAAGGAIDGLLKKVEKFFQSADFAKWLAHFKTLVGPAITAIGTGIGHVISAIGTLMTRFSAADVKHAINIFFDVIVGAIRITVNAIGWLMTAWDKTSQAIAHGWRNVEIWTLDAVKGILTFIGWLVQGFASAFGWIPGLGPKLRKNAAEWRQWVNDINNDIASLQDHTIYINVVASRAGYIQNQQTGGYYQHGGSGTNRSGGRNPSASNGSGNTASIYHVHVNGGNDTGRAVVQAIKTFEQHNGSSWRK